MKVRFVLAALVGVLSASIALAQNGFVAAGVGSLGNWDTYVELANPFDEPMNVLFSEFAFNGIGGCDFGCNVGAAVLPPHGSQRFKIENGVVNPEGDPRIVALAPDHLFTLFINTDPSSRDLLPIAHVHSVNRASGAQTELPVIGFKSLMTRPRPKQLTFPGVSKANGEHCNLVLTSIDSDFSVIGLSATLSLRDSSGTLLGTKSISFSPADCLFVEQVPYVSKGCANIFVADVVAQMGVASVVNGVLDVSQTFGGDALWGQLYCVAGTGSVTTYSGHNP